MVLLLNQLVLAVQSLVPVVSVLAAALGKQLLRALAASARLGA